MFVGFVYMFPYSFALTFWRFIGVVATSSLGICSINALIRTQYYCGGTVSIEALLWGHFVLIYRNRKEFDVSTIRQGPD